MKRTKRRMTVCTVLLLCNLVFIWGNSLLPAEVSGQISGTLKALLDGVFTPGEAVPSGGDGLLRKFAHFAEFGALGLLLGWLFRMLGKSSFRRSRWAWPLPASTRPSRPSSPAAAPASGTCALTAAARPPVCSCCFWGMLIGRDDLPEIISGGNET